MPKFSIFASILFLATAGSALAAEGCGPEQVCAYKGQLKAGQACPASFCQSAYSDGLAALAKGGVLRIQKKAEAPLELKGAIEEKEAPKAEQASEWKDPPARAPKEKLELSDPTATRSAELTSRKCHNYKLLYADLPAECKTVLDLEALGLRGTKKESAPNSFCRNAYPEDDAGYDRCVGKTDAPEMDADALIAAMLKTKAKITGSLEKICRRRNAGDEEGFQKCVSTRAIVQSRGVAAKSAPKAAAKEEAPATSMSIDGESAD